MRFDIVELLTLLTCAIQNLISSGTLEDKREFVCQASGIIQLLKYQQCKLRFDLYDVLHWCALIKMFKKHSFVSECLLRLGVMRVLCCSVCLFQHGHFVRVPLNLTCIHCLQQFSFEQYFNLYYSRIVFVLFFVFDFARAILSGRP